MLPPVKSWQIFLVGAVVLIVLFAGQAHFRYAPVILAALMIAVILAGFLLVPDCDHWKVWMKTYDFAEDEEETVSLYSSHEPIAVQAQVANLWLLYLPTMLAVGYLLLASARGVPQLRIEELAPYPVIFILRLGVAAVWVLLSSWGYERWVLRRAAAAQIAGTAALHEYMVGYYFRVEKDVYGGESFPWRSYDRNRVLRRTVMFRRDRPERNLLIPGFIFHRFEIAARGVQDLEKARESAQATRVVEDAG